MGKDEDFLQAARDCNKSLLYFFLQSSVIDLNIQSEAGWTALHYAAYHSSSDTLELLLTKAYGANVEATTKDRKWTPLHLAAKSDSPDVVRILLESKASIEAKDNEGNTPLLLAAGHGSAKVAECLLSHGANPEATNKFSYTSMHHAAHYGHASVITILNKYGANIEAQTKKLSRSIRNANPRGSLPGIENDVQVYLDKEEKDPGGQTPLHMAARNGQPDAVERLIKLKAQVEARDHAGKTPLLHASRKNQLDVLRVLVFQAHVDINATDKYGDCALHVLNGEEQESKYSETFEFLVTNHIDINIANKKGKTALHKAYHAGNKSMVEMLLKAGADSTISPPGELSVLDLTTDKNNQDYNASGELILAKSMDLAIETGKTELVKRLVEHVNLNEQCQDIPSPLLKAVECGKAGFVDLLIENGADVNVTDKDDNTGLHFAAGKDNRHIVEKLIEKGADCNKANKDGNTVLHAAVIQQHSEVAQVILRKTNIDVDVKNNLGATMLNTAAFHDTPHIVEALLEKKADSLIPDKHGDSPLHAAVQQKNGAIVKILLKHGHSLDSTNEHGYTPLIEAALSGDVDILQDLLNAGADIEVVTKNGENVLHMAANQPKCLELLLKHAQQKSSQLPSSMVNAATTNGCTPLHFASAGEIESVKLLLQKEYNADFRRKDNTGRTPYDVAQEYGRTDIVEYYSKQLHTTTKHAKLFTMEDLKKATKAGNFNLKQIPPIDEIPKTYGIPETDVDNRKIKDIVHRATKVALADLLGNQFPVKLIPIGSSAEGTKLAPPDEQDYMVEIGDISKGYDMIYRIPKEGTDVHELPTGYVLLRPKDNHSTGKTQPLLSSSPVARCVNSVKFHRMMFRKFEDALDELDLTDESDQNENIKFEPGYIKDKACSTFTVHWKSVKHGMVATSVDFVPSIRRPGEWPKKARENISKNLLEDGYQQRGIHLVSKPPQEGSKIGKEMAQLEKNIRREVWHTTFSVFEVKMMENIPQEVRDVYITAKYLRKKVPLKFIDDKKERTADDFLTSYMMKTAFLQIMQEDEGDDEMERRFHKTHRLEEMLVHLFKKVLQMVDPEKKKDTKIGLFFLPDHNILDTATIDPDNVVVVARYLLRFAEALKERTEKERKRKEEEKQKKDKEMKKQEESRRSRYERLSNEEDVTDQASEQTNRQGITDQTGTSHGTLPQEQQAESEITYHSNSSCFPCRSRSHHYAVQESSEMEGYNPTATYRSLSEHGHTYDQATEL